MTRSREGTTYDLLCKRRKIDDIWHNRHIFKTHVSWIRRLEVKDLLTHHTGCVNSIRWDETGKLLVSGSDDRELGIWTLDPSWTFRLLSHHSTQHEHNIFDAVFRPGRPSEVVSCAADGTICFSDLQARQCELMHDAHGVASKISFQPLSDQVFLVTARSDVLLFDLRAKRTDFKSVYHANTHLTAVEFAPFGLASFSLNPQSLF